MVANGDPGLTRNPAAKKRGPFLNYVWTGLHVFLEDCMCGLGERSGLLGSTTLAQDMDEIWMFLIFSFSGDPPKWLPASRKPPQTRK